MDEIISKLDILRKQFPDEESISTLADWEKQAKVAVITANLQENDAIKIIISNYKDELQKLNKILTDDKSLFANEDGRLLGQTIHARKEWCQRFLSIFNRADAAVDSQNSRLDNIINNPQP